MIRIPNDGGALVSLIGLPPNAGDTQTAIVLDCILAGVDEPILQGVQVDGCLEGDSTTTAPTGQAFAWITLSDSASEAQQTAVQTVLDNRAP